MRTTIRLDDHLLREAKARAARAGRSLNEFIEDAVRSAVLDNREPSRHTHEIPVFRGGRGLRPGVDLDSNAALMDLLDDDPP
ncbi:MAG TPA: YlcI/YnfO family protein [Gemmatimonas sp.]|nr:YlcI/YnfO family protein [Gemmatimonas sp.]